MPVRLLPFDPNPDGSCRSCRGPIDPNTWLCTRCGTAHGERNRCPHCQTVARTLPHPVLLHRCSVCGKPRFPAGTALLFDKEAAALQLREAGRAHRLALALRIFGYVLLAVGLPGLVLTALVLLILTPGAWVTGIALGFALIPLLLWMWIRHRNDAAGREQELALDQAYSQAILGLLRASPDPRDTRAIAESLRLPLERTERLVGMLNARDQITSAVTDEGELLFGINDPPRMRIAEWQPDSPQNANPPGDIVEAEIDAVDENIDLQRRRT